MAIKKKKVSVPVIWLTVYGDLITNITLFFLMLFGSVVLALKKGYSMEEFSDYMRGVADSIYERKAQENRELQETKRKISALQGVAGVILAEREMRIILPEPVLFDVGLAKLKDSAKDIVSGVGKVLAATPYNFIVEGHTCDLPIVQKPPRGMMRWQLAMARSTGLGPYYSNRELSGARALQVLQILTREKIIAPERLSAGACGSAEPLVPNTGEENRRQNRRVEIKAVLKGEKS